MAPDFAVYYVASPGGMALLLAILAIPTLLVRSVASRAFERLGLRRVAQGYCAVIAAMFGLSVLVTGGSSLSMAGYAFALALVFTLPFASIVVMPVAVCLVRMRVATVAVMAAGGVTTAIGIGLLAVASPSNDWSRAHRLESFLNSLVYAGTVTTVVFSAFALGARMPFWRPELRAPGQPASGGSPTASSSMQNNLEGGHNGS